MNEDLLFYRETLHDRLVELSNSVIGRVAAVGTGVLLARTDDDLAGELLDTFFKLEPLVLDETTKTMKQYEVDIDISHEPYRGVLPGSRTVVPGIRVVVAIPFRGDPSLWNSRPSTYTLSPPRGTIGRLPSGLAGTVELTIEQPTSDPPENIKTQLESRLSSLRMYVANQYDHIAGYERQLYGEIKNAIAKRRTRLARHDEVRALLGIPEIGDLSASLKISTSATATIAGTGVDNQSTVQTKTWDVFISHASEDKEEVARPIAESLKAFGLEVWFDASVLSLGDSLRSAIDKGLANSRYAVVIVSQAFLSKEWPQRELDGLIAQEDDERKVVLPI